jgi:hypothetical protein
MALILERVNIVEGFPPVDLSAAAKDGDWVGLRHYRRVAVVFAGGVGTSGEDPVLTIEQAQDASGTGAKALNFTTVYVKQSATDLSDVTGWTKVVQAEGNTYTSGTGAEEALIWVVEFQASDLDVANGYRYVRGRLNDVGVGAQPGYLFYLLADPAHQAAPENALDPLA